MKTLLAAATIAFMGQSAQSLTLNFDTVPTIGDVDEWSEQGFSGDLVSLLFDGRPEINGPGGALSGIANIFSDRLFTAQSMDLTANGGFNFDSEGNDLADRVPYASLRFEGFRDGALVAAAEIATAVTFTSFTYVFSPAFSLLDQLRISTPYDAIGPNGEFCIDCSTILFDSLTVDVEGPAPVPLPASGMLLLSGVVGAIAVARRRRR
ncbi:hypothetical protein QCN27_18020 [Cereibacter sp. SYSU M97828]|nr:hypothetical protein [Cereibacter flavus]